MKLSDSK